MSIRPVDFNGMIQNTTELQSRENELVKQPAIQQENIAVSFEREKMESSSKVNEKADTAEDNGNVDPDEEGERSQYKGNGGKKKQKKEKMGDGSVRLKSLHQSFDIKV